MSKQEFRAIYLPYCLQKQADGRYAVLNRNYKPLGIVSSDFLDYMDQPSTLAVKGLTVKVAAKISKRGDANAECIYLYNDGTVPTNSKKDWDAYSSRLEVLSKLMVEWP